MEPKGAEIQDFLDKLCKRQEELFREHLSIVREDLTGQLYSQFDAKEMGGCLCTQYRMYVHVYVQYVQRVQHTVCTVFSQYLVLSI